MRFLLLSCLMVFAFEVDASTKQGRGGGKRGGAGSSVVTVPVVDTHAEVRSPTEGDAEAEDKVQSSVPEVLRDEEVDGGASSTSENTDELGAAVARPDSVVRMIPLPAKIFDAVRSRTSDGFVLEKQSSTASSPVTRLLSLDTGDSNGLVTALILAVLDEILKHPLNQKDGVATPSVKGVFQVFSAISMGNLIAALLVHGDRSKTPLQILQFFYKSLSSEVFNADQLRNNLLKLFGTSPVKDAFSQPVYLWASSSERGFCFTNRTFVDPLGKQVSVKPENTPVPDALRAAIARVSISPSKIASNAGGHIEVKDGTPYADAQAFSSHQHLKDKNVEVYSVGFGHNVTDRTEAARRNEEAALEHVLRDLLSATSPLCYFGQIQPVLGNSVGYDSTDPHAQRNCIEASIRAVFSPAFRDMVRQLGFSYPETDMDGICGKVCAGMKALSSKDRERLHESEVDWLIRKIKAFDYEMLIQGKVYCFDGTEARLMTSAEYDALMGSIAQAEKAKYGTKTIEEILGIAKKLRDPCQALPKVDQRFWGLLKTMNPSEAQGYFRLIEGQKLKAFWESVKRTVESCVEVVTAVVPKSLSSKLKVDVKSPLSAPHSSRNLAAAVPVDDTSDFDDLTDSKEPTEDDLAKGFENAFIETQIAHIDANNFLIHFMQDYLKFLDASGFSNHTADGIDKASMLYLRARFGDQPFIDHAGLAKLSLSINAVIEAIFATGCVTWFFSATRFPQLHKALDVYIGTHFVSTVSMEDDD